MPEPTQDQTEQRAGRRWGRLVAYLLAYSLAALPGAFAALQGRHSATRETVRKVNSESAVQVSQLQEWAKATRTDLDAVSRSCEARTDKLREEVQRGQTALMNAILELARQRRPRVADLQSATKTSKPAKRVPPRKLPTLVPPPASLEQVEAKVK
jgi:hypothetical protein